MGSEEERERRELTKNTVGKRSATFAARAVLSFPRARRSAAVHGVLHSTPRGSLRQRTSARGKGERERWGAKRPLQTLVLFASAEFFLSRALSLRPPLCCDKRHVAVKESQGDGKGLGGEGEERERKKRMAHAAGLSRRFHTIRASPSLSSFSRVR